MPELLSLLKNFFKQLANALKKGFANAVDEIIAFLKKILGKEDEANEVVDAAETVGNLAETAADLLPNQIRLADGSIINARILSDKKDLEAVLGLAKDRERLNAIPDLNILEHEGVYFIKYKDENIILGLEKNAKEELEHIFKKGGANVEKEISIWVKSFNEELKQIDGAITKLKIDLKIPKNNLSISESFKRVEKIYDKLKNMEKSNKFNPNKNALQKYGYKVNLSKNGVSADYKGSNYLYKTSGKEKNVVKIKLTGDRENDKLLCWELSGIKPTKDINDSFTWHHMNDFNPIDGTCEMQLVMEKVHRASKPHYGSTALIDYFHQKAIYSKKLSLKI